MNKSKTYTKDLYKNTKLSDELFADNIKDLYIWSEKYEKENNVKGFYKEHFKWVDSILEMKVIKLGRLQFEVLENIDDLSNVFEETKDFLFVNVHIREGEKLTPEECEKSYDMAINFYKSRGYKFSTVVFVCYSWLLSPNLKNILSEESNIIKFQKKYTFLSSNLNEKYPQIIERVFVTKSENAEDWDENTSLQRKLKEEWKKGMRFPMTKGYFIKKI